MRGSVWWAGAVDFSALDALNVPDCNFAVCAATASDADEPAAAGSKCGKGMDLDAMYRGGARETPCSELDAKSQVPEIEDAVRCAD